MLCRTAAVRSLAAARAALARSDIPDPPFEGPEVPTKTFFFFDLSLKNLFNKCGFKVPKKILWQTAQL